MAVFGAFVFEGKLVDKFCHYCILKLHPNRSYTDATDFILPRAPKNKGGGENSFTENGGPLLCGNKVKTCLNLYTSNSLTQPELLQLKKKKKTLPGYLQGLQFTLL